MRHHQPGAFGAALRLCEGQLQLRCACALAAAVRLPDPRLPQPNAPVFFSSCLNALTNSHLDTAEGLIPYGRWYHCDVANHNLLLRGGYLVSRRSD